MDCLQAAACCSHTPAERRPCCPAAGLPQFWSHLQLIEAYLLARGVPVAVLSSNVMKRKDDMRAQLSKWVPSMAVAPPARRAPTPPNVLPCFSRGRRAQGHVAGQLAETACSGSARPRTLVVGSS